MHLLPYLEYRISSKRTPEEIYGILKSVTDSERHVFSRSMLNSWERCILLRLRLSVISITAILLCP